VDPALKELDPSEIIRRVECSHKRGATDAAVGGRGGLQRRMQWLTFITLSRGIVSDRFLAIRTILSLGSAFAPGEPRWLLAHRVTARRYLLCLMTTDEQEIVEFTRCATVLTFALPA
jgi:hypothetical protein